MNNDTASLLYQATLQDSTAGATPIVWRHMCALSDDTKQWLKTHTQIDDSIVDAMLAEDTRPRALLKDDGVLLVFRAINNQDVDHPEDMISLRMWVDCENIITTRRRDIQAIKNIQELIQQERGPKNTSEFLSALTNEIYSDMEEHIDELEDCIDISEEKIASGNIDDIQSHTATLRRRTAIYRRYINPQSKVIETLLGCGFPWILEEDKEQLVESLDRITRYREILNDIKERSQILNEELRNVHAERLNTTTYIFSIAATIFLPLSFLTGLLGVNIGGIPGINNNAAFLVFTLICAVIIAIQLFIFKKLKWF